MGMRAFRASWPERSGLIHQPWTLLNLYVDWGRFRFQPPNEETTRAISRKLIDFSLSFFFMRSVTLSCLQAAVNRMNSSHLNQLDKSQQNIAICMCIFWRHDVETCQKVGENGWQTGFLACGGIAVIASLSEAIWCQNLQPLLVSSVWTICPRLLRKYTDHEMPHNRNVYWLLHKFCINPLGLYFCQEYTWRAQLKVMYRNPFISDISVILIGMYTEIKKKKSNSWVKCTVNTTAWSLL